MGSFDNHVFMCMGLGISPLSPYSNDQLKQIDQEAEKVEEKIEAMRESILEKKKMRTTLLRNVGKIFKKVDKNNKLCASINEVRIKKRSLASYNTIKDEDFNYLLEIIKESLKTSKEAEKQEEFKTLMMEITKNETELQKVLQKYNKKVEYFNRNFCRGVDRYYRLHTTPYKEYTYLVNVSLLWGVSEQKAKIEKIWASILEKKRFRATLLDSISKAFEENELSDAIQKAKKSKPHSPKGLIVDKDFNSIIEIIKRSLKNWPDSLMDEIIKNEKSIQELVSEHNKFVQEYNNIYCVFRGAFENPSLLRESTTDYTVIL